MRLSVQNGAMQHSAAACI